MEEKLHIPLTNISVGRFGFLLFSILLMFILRPFLVGYIRLEVLMDIFILVIVVSVIYAVSWHKRVFMIALAIAIPMLALKWSYYFFNISAILFVADGISVVFTAYATIIVLSYVFTKKEITADVIFAAISGFFMIGLMWAFVFSVLEFILPGSFHYPQVEGDRLTHTTYYSFVTLTTLGYGDITPATGAASSFSLLEAVIGQIYMTVLIAILVGKYISQSMEKKSR